MSGRCRFETAKPVRPALGAEPRPVAPSSRISPPAPVAAPGKGLIAVGWLWVSTFINTWTSSGCSTYALGPSAERGAQLVIWPPSMIEELSE